MHLCVCDVSIVLVLLPYICFPEVPRENDQVRPSLLMHIFQSLNYDYSVCLHHLQQVSQTLSSPPSPNAKKNLLVSTVPQLKLETKINAKKKGREWYKWG